MRSFLYYSISILLLTTLSGCYILPEEDHISTTPITNNPNVIPQKGSSLIPGIKY